MHTKYALSPNHKTYTNKEQKRTQNEKETSAKMRTKVTQEPIRFQLILWFKVSFSLSNSLIFDSNVFIFFCTQMQYLNLSHTIYLFELATAIFSCEILSHIYI